MARKRRYDVTLELTRQKVRYEYAESAQEAEELALEWAQDKFEGAEIEVIDVMATEGEEWLR